MKNIRLKKMPPLRTDDEAEDFLANENLADYDWTGLREVNFRFQPGIEKITLALPGNLAEEIKKRARKDGLTSAQYITRALEAAIGQ